MSAAERPSMPADAVTEDEGRFRLDVIKARAIGAGGLGKGDRACELSPVSPAYGKDDGCNCS